MGYCRQLFSHYSASSFRNCPWPTDSESGCIMTCSSIKIFVSALFTSFLNNASFWELDHIYSTALLLSWPLPGNQGSCSSWTPSRCAELGSIFHTWTACIVHQLVSVANGASTAPQVAKVKQPYHPYMQGRLTNNSSYSFPDLHRVLHKPLVCG